MNAPSTVFIWCLSAGTVQIYSYHCILCNTEVHVLALTAFIHTPRLGPNSKKYSQIQQCSSVNRPRFVTMKHGKRTKRWKERWASNMFFKGELVTHRFSDSCTLPFVFLSQRRGPSEGFAGFTLFPEKKERFICLRCK